MRDTALAPLEARHWLPEAESLLLLIIGQLRYLGRTPGATAASVLATALGTMSVVAVHLMSEDIKAGLDEAGSLPIPGYTHVVRGSALTWDDYFDARDRWRHGEAPRVEAMTPLVAGPASVHGRAARILGLDVLAQFRGEGKALPEDWSADESAGMVLGDGVAVSSSLGLALGDTVRAGGIDVQVMSVVALAEDLVFADIPTALGILGRTAPTAVLVRVRGGESFAERWFPGSTAAFDLGTDLELGQGLTAQAIDEAEPARRFALAILFNLGALGVLALFVAGFLIYQASYSNIARRRRERERLIAVGVGAGTLRLLFVFEGALIGLAGAMIGTLLGTLLAEFFASTVAFSTTAMTKGILGGVGAGVIGAFAATRHATLRRQTEGPRWFVVALAGVLLAGAALSDTLAAAFGLIVALCIMQFALLVPGVAVVLQRAFAARMGRVHLLVRANFRRFAALLAEVDVAASALSIAVAAAIGMGVQVENFREDFYRMLDQRLWRALYVESEEPVDVQWLRGLPGVTDVRSYGRTEALLNEDTVSVSLVVGDALESRRYGYDLALEGDILLSEAGALRFGLEVGDVIEIEGPRGERSVVVAHVFSDFGAPSPRVIATVDALAPILDGIVFDRASVLTAGDDTGALKRAISKRYPNAHVRDQVELRALAEAAFDRTFEVAERLTVVALLVAVLGLYNALSALVLRARDVHRLLYASGVSRRSIVVLAMWQNLLVGTVAVAVAVPLGLAIAYVLCAEVNPRAFGWSISFGVDVSAVLVPTLLGVAAALLAGLVPVWRGIRALGSAPGHAPA